MLRKILTIASVTFASDENQLMRDNWPNAAVYTNETNGSQVNLFNGVYDEIAGEPHPMRVDKSAWVLVDAEEDKPIDEDTGLPDTNYLTKVEFRAWADAAFDAPHTGIALEMTAQCVDYLFETKFKPPVEIL